LVDEEGPDFSFLTLAETIAAKVLFRALDTICGSYYFVAPVPPAGSTRDGLSWLTTIGSRHRP
jgi:hypothetical protein